MGEAKQQIIETTCEVCEITISELYSRTKRWRVVYARQIIAAILYNENICDIREIARVVGVQRNSAYYILFHPPIRERTRFHKELRELFTEVCKRLEIDSNIV